MPFVSLELLISSQVLDCERDYMCTKCRHVFTVQADFNQFYSFVNPTACPNPDSCKSDSFMCLSGGSLPATCKDYQEIKIQEKVGKPFLTLTEKKQRKSLNYFHGSYYFTTGTEAVSW